MADAQYREYIKIGIWSSARNATGAFISEDNLNTGPKKLNWKGVQPKSGEKEEKGYWRLYLVVVC